MPSITRSCFATALLLSLTLTACCRKPAPAPVTPLRPIVVTPVLDKPCLLSPSPLPPVAPFQVCPEPGDFAACMTDADFTALIVYLAAVKRWMAVAEVLCGPVIDATETTTTTPTS